MFEWNLWKNFLYCRQFINVFFGEIYDFTVKSEQLTFKKDFLLCTPDEFEVVHKSIDKMLQSTFDEILKKYVEINISPFREWNDVTSAFDWIFKAGIHIIIDQSKVSKEDYLFAIECSSIKDIEIKHVFKNVNRWNW